MSYAEADALLPTVEMPVSDQGLPESILGTPTGAGAGAGISAKAVASALVRRDRMFCNDYSISDMLLAIPPFKLVLDAVESVGLSTDTSANGLDPSAAKPVRRIGERMAATRACCGDLLATIWARACSAARAAIPPSSSLSLPLPSLLASLPRPLPSELSRDTIRVLLAALPREEVPCKTPSPPSESSSDSAMRLSNTDLLLSPLLAACPAPGRALGPAAGEPLKIPRGGRRPRPACEESAATPLGVDL